MTEDLSGVVAAVSADAEHRFTKPAVEEITLLQGLGVAGDAHAGVTVQHRSRVRADPTQPNLRQVHLIQAELHDELTGRGFTVWPGAMGENITTRGLYLLALPTGTRLRFGADGATVEITGLRNPCVQLNRFQTGLMKAVLDHDEAGQLIRRAGVMGIVLNGGPVRPGDPVAVDVPAGPHQPLVAV